MTAAACQMTPCECRRYTRWTATLTYVGVSLFCVRSLVLLTKMLLPVDVWCCIYRASTPRCRKTILTLNRDISDAIRPSLAACVSGSLWTPLPSEKRFVHLSEVYTEITTADAHEIWKFAFFRSNRHTLRLHFESLYNYRLGVVTRIYGAHAIEVSVSSSADMLNARKLLSACSGLVHAHFVGDSSMRYHGWGGCLASVSLERVLFQDLPLPCLNTPSLLQLTWVTAWNISINPGFFSNLPRLKDLIITANRSLTAIHLPPSLTLFHMFCRRPTNPLEVYNTSNLKELHLYNVNTTIQLGPFLAQLTLYNTRVNLTPEQIISHPSLEYLSLLITNPSVTQVMAWNAHQKHKAARGCCRPEVINLRFEFH